MMVSLQPIFASEASHEFKTKTVDFQRWGVFLWSFQQAERVRRHYPMQAVILQKR